MPARKARSRESYLAEAARICKKHGGIYYVTRPDCFLLYRSHPHSGKGILIGRRRTPAQLNALVHQAVQTTPASPADNLESGAHA